MQSLVKSDACRKIGVGIFYSLSKVLVSIKYSVVLLFAFFCCQIFAAAKYSDWELAEFKSYGPGSVGEFYCCAPIKIQFLVSGKLKRVIKFERQEDHVFHKQRLHIKTKQIDSLLALLKKHLNYDKSLEEQEKAKFGSDRVRVFSKLYKGKPITVI